LLYFERLFKLLPLRCLTQPVNKMTTIMDRRYKESN